MTSRRRIGAVAQASRSKIVVAVFGLAILLAGCSGTPNQVMVVGSILYSEGSFAASDDGTCNPAPNITEVKVETRGFNPFGDVPSDSTTGHIMSDGVVVGTGCWMAFETGSVEYHFSGGQWSESENLGDIINSKGNEMFPYFPNSDELVFASNGHGGPCTLAHATVTSQRRSFTWSEANGHASSGNGSGGGELPLLCRWKSSSAAQVSYHAARSG